MSDFWENGNLPENHQLVSNIIFVAVTEGTWNRKKQDGTNEVAPKWDYISTADETGTSMQIGVYSSTDKEELKLNTPYDVIVKRAVGKDGTFYGYSLKGFGPAGQPIPKKEPQSRFQKGLRQSNKSYALQAAATLFAMRADDTFMAVEQVITAATTFESWLEGNLVMPPQPVASEEQQPAKTTPKK